MSPVDGAALAPAQRARFEGERNAQIIDRARWGVILATLFCVGLALFMPHHFPGTPTALAPIVCGATCMLAFALTFIRGVQRRPSEFIMLLGLVVTGCIGIEARLTGGFSSPLVLGLLLLWMFCTAVVPLGVGWLVLGIVTETAAVYAVVLTGPSPGSPWLPTALILCGAAFCVVGSILRDRAAEQTFLARQRLDELNERLTERVDEQVKVIVARAREVELLNEQLRQRVRERSEELAAALRQLAGQGRALDRAQPGDVIGGRVRIVRPLGEGGMGTVYLGEDLITGGKVAVKLMRPGVATDASALQRFVGEAAAAAAISHPGVIKTLHVDVSTDGRMYQIMELVEGPTLGRRIDAGGLTPGECARVGAGIADALAAAHGNGVVHRDIKPSNIILCHAPPGIRVLDFGLSKLLAGEGRIDQQQTQAHELLGTPAYMSPEQVLDPAHVGAPTDVYALGIVLYQMIAGRLPFDARGAPSLLQAHVHEQPKPLGEVAPLAPAELAALIHACLSKTPTDRPTAPALARELEALADRLGAPPLARICERRALDDATGPTLQHKAG